VQDPFEFDPIQTAEDLGLGIGTAIGLQMINNEEKLRILKETGDIHNRMTPDEFEACLNKNGFETVLKEDFKHMSIFKEEGEKEDTFYVLWHPDGYLVVADTYWNKKTMNSVKLYFQCRARGEKRWPPGGISGGFTDDVFAGFYDGRDGVMRLMNMLEEDQIALPKWEVEGTLDVYLLSFADWGNQDTRPYDVRHNEHKARSLARGAKLPRHVLDAIGSCGGYVQ